MAPKSGLALRSSGASIIAPSPKPKAAPKAAVGSGSRAASSSAATRGRSGSGVTPGAVSKAGHGSLVSTASQRTPSTVGAGPRTSADSRPTSAAAGRPTSAAGVRQKPATASEVKANKTLTSPGNATDEPRKTLSCAPEAVIESIRRPDIVELKSLPVPPERIKKVLGVVCFLLTGSASFIDCQKMLASSSFLANLRAISEQIRTGTLPVERVNDVRPTLENLSADFSNERGKLRGEIALYRWAVAVVGDYDKTVAGATSLRQPHLQRTKTLGHELSGMSVYHLASPLMTQISAAGLEPTTTVYEMEPLVIRPAGAKIVCPRDAKLGAAYVDCFEDPDDVGIASFMLSYSWGYRVSDIVNTLTCHCEDQALDQRRTYVWVCCLCINQHRVQETRAKGELVPFEEFRLAFKKRVETIGHVIAMMSPWRAPLYISRVWCNFELFTATAQHIDVSICMPPEEVSDFMMSLQTGSGIDEMWKVLTNVKVENANASVPEDKESILRLIRDGIGFNKFDSAVAKYLQTWITRVSESSLRGALSGSTELSANKKIVTLCARVGDLVLRVGKPSRAIEIFEEGRRILKETDYDQAKWEELFLDHIGIAKRQLGDLDGAEKAYADAQRLTSATSSLGKSRHADITNLGILKMQRGDFKGALADFEAALKLSEADPDSERLTPGNILLNLGNVKAKLQDLDGSVASFSRAKVIFEECKQLETPTGALLLSNLGNVWRMRSEFALALEEYATAERLFEKTGTLDTPNGATLLMNLAMVKGQTGDAKGALEEAERAKTLFEKLGMTQTPASQQAMKIIGFAKSELGLEAESS